MGKLRGGGGGGISQGSLKTSGLRLVREMQSPYFELASKLWEEHDKKPLTHTAVVLYFRLLHEANSRYWKGPMRLSWNYLIDILNLRSRSTLSKAISDLKTRKLIEYYKDGKRAYFWFPSVHKSVQIMDQKKDIGPINGPIDNIGPNNGPIETISPNNGPMIGPINGPKTKIGPINGPVTGPTTGPITGPNTGPINNINTKIQKDINTKDSVYINNYTHSGVSKTEEEKEPPPEESTEPPEELPSYELPSDCVGIPCGKILELYAMHFKKPPMQRIRPAEAKVIRERYIENPNLDWNGFLEWVAKHKSNKYTLYQLFMYKVFYQLFEEYQKHIEFEKKMDKIAKEVKREKSQVRTGKIVYIGDILKRTAPG